MHLYTELLGWWLIWGQICLLQRYKMVDPWSYGLHKGVSWTYVDEWITKSRTAYFSNPNSCPIPRVIWIYLVCGCLYFLGHCLCFHFHAATPINEDWELERQYLVVFLYIYICQYKIYHNNVYRSNYFEVMIKYVINEKEILMKFCDNIFMTNLKFLWQICCY